MKKNNKNVKFKSLITGTLVSIILGIFCYFILNFVSNNNHQITPNNKNLNLIYQLKHRRWEEGEINIPIFDEKIILKNDLTTKKEYIEKKLLGSIPIRMYSFENENYVMNDSQFQTFVDKLEEKLPYGPEIYGLNMININNVKGNHFDPVYKYINLEIKPFYKSSNNVLNEKGKLNPNYISFYDNYISTAVHEYLHYLEEIYAKSFFEESSKKLYDLGGDTIATTNEIPTSRAFYVNKKFIENFKKILNYNNENLLTPSESSAVSVNKNNPEVFAPKSNKKLSLISVANKYPVKWMWDRVNESSKVDLKIPKGQENLVIGSKKYFDFIYYNKDLHSIWSKKQYYWYKYSELFARRFTSLLYKEDKNKIEKLGLLYRWKDAYIFDNGIRRFDFTTSKNDFRFSRITPTIHNPLKILDSYNLSLKTQDIWFDDYPYDLEEVPNLNHKDYHTYRSTKLYNSLRKLMGQYNGSDISWIIRNNKFKYRNWTNFKTQKNILSYINGIWNLVKQKKSKHPTLEIPKWIWNNLNNFRFEPSTKNDNFLLRFGGYLTENDIRNLGLSLSSFNQKSGLEVELGLLNDDFLTVKRLNKKVIIHKYNVKKVSSFIENEYIDFEPLDNNYFWVVNNLDNQNIVKNSNNKFLEDFDYENDFIDLKKVENKRLVLFNKNNLTKFIPLKTTRYENKDEMDEFGKTTTILNKTILQRDKEYAIAIEEDNFAKIKKNKTLFD